MQRSYNKLFILLLIFIMPIIVSGILFYNHSYFHLKTLNHGVLINPPIQVENFKDNTKKWRVIYIADQCDDACQEINYELSQVKKALGKDSDRVVTKFILTKSLPASLFQREGQTHPFEKERLSSQSGATPPFEKERLSNQSGATPPFEKERLSNQSGATPPFEKGRQSSQSGATPPFEKGGQSSQSGATPPFEKGRVGGIFLIDPLNNAFMYYPSDVNPMYVLKDLKRVLEVSQIG